MVSRHKLTEFYLKEGDFKLVIRNQPHAEASATAAPTALPVVVSAPSPMMSLPPQPIAPAPVVSAPAPAAAPPPAAAAGDEAKWIAIKSPMVGTFYRSPSPDKPAFIKVGDMVDVGARVCIIEAMKLFNEIESDVKGKIVKVLVEDASPVEYEQPLFMVDPS